MPKKMDNIIKELIEQYLESDRYNRPWIIGFSGGKAFDRGLISISDDYMILFNKNLVKNQRSASNISQFAEKQIFLPHAEELYPDLGNIAVHRKKFGF
jgi:hypothetical protein